MIKVLWHNYGRITNVAERSMKAVGLESLVFPYVDLLTLRFLTGVPISDFNSTCKCQLKAHERRAQPCELLNPIHKSTEAYFFIPVCYHNV
jgi:hypothetical protein